MTIKKVRLSKRILVDKVNHVEVSMEAELDPGDDHREALARLEDEVNTALAIEGTADLYQGNRPFPETAKPAKDKKAAPAETPAAHDDGDDFSDF